MRQILLGLIFWSFSASALATPIFVEGANSLITRGITALAQDGGDGVTSSSVHYNPPLSASDGRAVAGLNSSIGQPINLSASAESVTNPSLFVNSDASGIQRFRYTGPTATTLTATVRFGGTISATGSGRITAHIALINAVGDMNALIPDFNDASLYTDLFGAGTHSASTLGLNQLTVTGAGTYNNLERFISITVNPNDEFFLYGQINVNASGGNETSTNQGRFFLSGTNQLEQVSAVPVPAAVWLMGSALMGLFGFKRKTA